MANANQPAGFIPRRHLAGGVIRAHDGFNIQSAYATALYRGDAVVLTSGYLAKGAENSAAILGIFAGCRYVDNSTKRMVFSPIWPAAQVTDGSADAEAFVYVDRNITYKVQSYSVTAYVDATHKGGSYDLISNTSGSSVTGQSGMELNLGDTGTGQFKVLGFTSEPDNAVGANAKLEVVLATPLFQL